MKYNLFLLILLSGINSFSQEKEIWDIYSGDRKVSVKNYYDTGYEKLDSIVFKYESKKIRFTNRIYGKDNELILKYNDSLSMPFDNFLPKINHIINLNSSTFIAIGKNKGIEKMFTNYLNIIIIDKSTNKIKQWISAMANRGNWNPVILVDEHKREIKLPKEENCIFENKVYALDYKKNKYKVINTDENIKYFTKTKRKKVENSQKVFTIHY